MAVKITREYSISANCKSNASEEEVNALFDTIMNQVAIGSNYCDVEFDVKRLK